MAKWNEGLRIEEAMGGKAVFAGNQGLPQIQTSVQPQPEQYLGL
jgi:hypothetical protein